MKKIYPDGIPLSLIVDGSRAAPFIREQHIKKSHRIDYLRVAAFSTIMLIAVIYLTLTGFFSYPHGIPLSLILMWGLISLVMIIMWIKGLTECDLIINNNGIQLPRSKIRNILSRPKLRNYNSISHLKIAYYKHELGRDFEITFSFEDGYSGKVNSWELSMAGLSKEERKNFLAFMNGIKKRLSG